MGLKRWKAEKSTENGTLVVFINESKDRAGMLEHQGSTRTFPLIKKNVLDFDSLYVRSGLTTSQLSELFLPGSGWIFEELA
jgi:hypothetical protein